MNRGSYLTNLVFRILFEAQGSSSHLCHETEPFRRDLYELHPAMAIKRLYLNLDESGCGQYINVTFHSASIPIQAPVQRR